MTEDRLAEIKLVIERAWNSGPLTSDVAEIYAPELLVEVERQSIEIADRENSHIALYNDYQTEKAKCSATLQVLIGAEEEIARLRKALGFYADMANHRIDWYDVLSTVGMDFGKIAREALQNGEG